MEVLPVVMVPMVVLPGEMVPPALTVGPGEMVPVPARVPPLSTVTGELGRVLLIWSVPPRTLVGP